MAKPTLTELWDAPPPSAPAPTPPVAPVAAPEVVPEPVDMPPAPVAPARKVSLTEAWESSGDRAPTVRVDALKEDLARGGALLATATRAERKREGASDEEADAAAKAITDTALVLGDNADSGRVREALAARVGVDTLDKAVTRAFGQRIMEVPLAGPTKAERQQKLRDQELENRSVEKGLAAAWKGEGSTERLAEEGEIRPWVEAVDRLGWNSGEDVLTSVFSGGLVPAYKLITNAPEIVKGYATDKDVQNLTGLAGSAMSAGVAPLLTGGEDPFSRTIRAMAVSSGLPDVTAAGMDALGFDSYSVSEFADNVHAKPEFDAAVYDLVTKGDRAAFEAVPFNKLPEMAKGELVDAARVREAIRSGKPGFEPLAGMEDLRDDVLSTQASFLPVSVIRTIQPDAVPDDLRIKDVFAKREAAKPWRGDDMGASAAKLMNSALLRPAGDGKTLMVAPGRFQELLRFANAVPAAVTNVNIGTDTPVFNAPLALPRAALYAAEEAGIPGAENIRGKVEAFKVPFLIGPGGIPIPQPAAWESMIQSGEYDDLLEAVGMFTSDRYANRYDPESTWLSRTLTEIANPDAAGQYLGDTYERLGGDPESTTARVLGTADLAVNIGMPAEEMALLPIAKATAATNRARRAANAARELGLNPTAARKAAKESVFVGSDPRQAVADSLTRAAVEGIRDGTLNPAKVPTATKKAIESVLRAAGMPEDLLTAEKGRPYAKIWDDLADRRARILETAADFETIGGPATQKLRASPEYRAVADQLDVFTRTRTMTPDEEAAVAADIAAGRVPKMTGNLSMRDRDLVLRFLEAAAFRAAEDGRVASPEEYFARHSWERGVEGEALPDGTLLSAEGAPTPRPDVNPQGFYSALRRAVEGLKGERFTADQLRATLKNTPGVKADEIEWTGLDRFLAEHPKPTKGEVLDWLDENAVVVEEKVLGTATPDDAALNAFNAHLNAQDEWIAAGREDEWVAESDRLKQVVGGGVEGPPHYTSYQLPGGTNYREVLFYGPATGDIKRIEPLVEAGTATPAQTRKYDEVIRQDPYRAPHFGREGEDLLAHTRVSDRVGPNGEKILHVEEVQSDWHQAGRERGYRDTARPTAPVVTPEDVRATRPDPAYPNAWVVTAPDGRTTSRFWADSEDAARTTGADELNQTAARANNIARMSEQPPVAPFAKNWHELVLKRILRMAADGGYDGVSWTTGVQQVKRYEDATRAAVDEIKYAKNAAGNVEVIGLKNGRETYRDTVPPEKLPDVLGKEIARKIVDSPDASGSLTGPDLTVGGEGMKGFYDRMIPQFLDKYAKKWGARPTQTTIDTTSGKNEWWILDATDGRVLDVATDSAGVRAWTDDPSAPRVTVEKRKSRPTEVVHYLPIPDNMRASILTEGQPLFSRKGGVTRGSISPGTPDTVNVPNPDYAAWEARVNALSAEVDALKAAPAEVPNPARAEWEAKGKATAAEVDELRAASNREMADLQARRESLQKNPRPDDPDWEAEVEEVNDRIGEITRTTSVNPTLAAKEAELAAMRANPPVATLPTDPDGVVAAKAEALARLRRFKIPKEIPKPSDVSRWLIKLFRTGDVKTAFHEGTHLLDLMMGEEWTRRAMEALGYDPTGPITTEVRERIAEAGTRALRGTLRPGSQLGNVFEDFRDTIGDVWRRVKREPAVTTPAFRKLWDKTFAPDDAEMMVAAHLVDQHGTGPLGRVVTTSGNVAEEIREGAQRAAGMAENAANVMRANQEIRQALGLTNDMTSIAVGDLLGRALAYTATTHALRGWGFGDLEGLTARTAVPAARAKRIQNEVAMYRKAVLGGKEAPTPVVVDGREVFMLNRDQQAGVRRMLADLANEPVSVDLPERLQDPRADLSQITREEWANIADRQLEVRAGAGAWRDRLAERAAVSAGIRFGQMAMDAARNQQSAVSAEANALRDAFVTTIAADEYLNPAAREVLKSVAREIGESGSRVKNAVIKAMNNGEKAWADAFKDVAASLPPEVVPVEELRTLRRVEPLATTDSFDEVAVGIPAISRLFTRAPVGSTAQMVQEQRSLSILDSIGLRLGGSEPPPPDVQFAPEVNPDAALGAFEQSATRFDDAIADAGYTRAEVDDAMATVQEGIKRRAAVFDNRASEIMHAFAGSDDVQVFAGMDPAKLTAAKYRAYESWYTGDWADNLLLNTELGQAARGPVYDQGMAVLNVLTRLEAAKVRASLARRLADVGVVADPASFLRGGVRLDRPYVFGTAANDVETITGEAYKQDVMHYLEAFTGWKMTSTNRLPTMETERVFAEATGMRAASGSVNKAAASDALRMIQSWGMKMGKGSAWETITLPDGGQIVMPTMFKEPIEKALADSAPLGGAFTSGPPKLGNIVPGTDEPIAAHYRAVNAALTMLGTAYQYSFGMLKTGLTTGMGPLIRPAFFMGNFIGGMGQLYQGVGAVKALEIMARPLLPTAEGRMTRAVIARMWNNGAGLTGTGAMMPAELGRFDAVGRWHSDQSLASGATRAGLNSSLVKTEFAQSIAEDIKAAEPTLWNRLMDSPKLKAAAGAVIGGAVAGPGGAVVGAGAFASLSRTWQDFFREAATGIDNYYRVSTYIGEVLRGVPEEQAAELARRVAFDYNNVTEFEKNYLRKGVLFYSFQRNNQNLFWWTLLNHPSRVMVQLRALRGAQQENYGEDAELFAPSWGEGRIPFRFRPAFEAGHADRAMQGAVTLTPRLSIADAVGLWQSLLGMTTELDPSAAGDLASKLNPWIQLSFVMSTGQDIHWQRSIEGFNTIPNWFVEMDENLTGGMVVNDLFGKVPAQYRNPSQEGYPGAPQWIVNPDGPHSRAWWVFRQMTMGGAMLDTITAMQRADFGDTLIEGGVVQKGVDLSRGAARADGREPLRNEPDTEMARSGLTEEEELGSWLGFKPVQVLDRDQALAPLIQRRESEQNAKMRTLKKEGERAYH